MKRTGRLIAFAFSIMALRAAGAEEPRVPGTPVKGVVAHGRVMALLLGKASGGLLRDAPLAGGPAHDAERRTIGVPPRVWQVAYGYVWASGNDDAIGGLNDVKDALIRYRLDGFLENKWITTPEVDETNMNYSCFIGQYSPLFNTRAVRTKVSFKFQLFYDYLPTAENAVLLFQLCNMADADLAGARLWSDSALDWKASDRINTLDEDADERKTPHWSLAMFGFKNKWDAKAGKWPPGIWERVGVIDVVFHEQFRVLGKGNDYYFVTDSGKLYRAPKPDKGTDRKMETVWDDQKQPVASFITDADADRSFLFCKPDKNGKGVYFEMSDKPDPQAYDASKVPEAKAADQLPAVLAYVKILLADKKIKDKP